MKRARAVVDKEMTLKLAMRENYLTSHCLLCLIVLQLSNLNIGELLYSQAWCDFSVWRVFYLWLMDWLVHWLVTWLISGHDSFGHNHHKSLLTRQTLVACLLLSCFNSSGGDIFVLCVQLVLKHRTTNLLIGWLCRSAKKKKKFEKCSAFLRPLPFSFNRLTLSITNISVKWK